MTAPADDSSGRGRFAKRRWSSADGLSLYARDYAGSAGPARLPVICLHGLTRNSKDFEEVAPWIAASGRRVIVPDMRGRGLSDRDPNPLNYVPKTYVRDVLRLMDSLGLARAVFVGTSMGGLIAMAMAAIRPRAIAATVLNDVGPEIAPEGIVRIMSYVGKKIEIRDWSDAADYVRDINGIAFPDHGEDDWRRFARRTFRDDNGVPELDYDPAITAPLKQGRFKPPRFLVWHLFRRLARRKPVLLVRGALSDVLSPEIAKRMRRRAPALQLVEVPNVGHAPLLDEPAAKAAIEKFLEATD